MAAILGVNRGNTVRRCPHNVGRRACRDGSTNGAAGKRRHGGEDIPGLAAVGRITGLLDPPPVVDSDQEVRVGRGIIDRPARGKWSGITDAVG